MNIKEYEEIIKNGQEKDFGFVTKLEMVSHMIGFDTYENLSDESKNKLLDFVYSYWLELDSTEHTEYSYIEAIFNSTQYIGVDIVSRIDLIDYEMFVNLIEEKTLL